MAIEFRSQQKDKQQMGWTCTRRPRWHYPASFGNQDISPRNHNTPGCTLGRSGQWYHGSYHPPPHWGLWQHEITPKPKQMDSCAKTRQGKEELGSASWRCPKQDRRHSPALLLICGFNILRMFLLGQIPKAPKFQSSECNWCYNGEKQKTSCLRVRPLLHAKTKQGIVFSLWQQLFPQISRCCTDPSCPNRCSDSQKAL